MLDIGLQPSHNTKFKQREGLCLFLHHRCAFFASLKAADALTLATRCFESFRLHFESHLLCIVDVY